MRAFAADGQRRPGPIHTSLGIISLTEATRSHQSILNRLGLCLSYKASATRRDAFADRQLAGNRQQFDLVPDTSLCIVAIDNLNSRNCHGLQVVGGNGNGGFDGLAMQAVGFGGREFVQPGAASLPEFYKLRDVAPNRAAFFNALLPGKKTQTLLLSALQSLDWLVPMLET